MDSEEGTEEPVVSLVEAGRHKDTPPPENGSSVIETSEISIFISKDIKRLVDFSRNFENWIFPVVIQVAHEVVEFEHVVPVEIEESHEVVLKTGEVVVSDGSLLEVHSLYAWFFPRSLELIGLKHEADVSIDSKGFSN